MDQKINTLLKDNKILKKIPKWWKFIPFMGSIPATFYPHIYFPEKSFENLKSNTPTVWNLSVVLHESVHLERQRGVFFWWCIKYFFSRKFLLNEELIAIKEQMKYLYSKGEVYPFEYKAKQFSSSTYLWVSGYEKSMKILKDMWNSVVRN